MKGDGRKDRRPFYLYAALQFLPRWRGCTVAETAHMNCTLSFTHIGLETANDDATIAHDGDGFRNRYANVDMMRR